MTMTLLDTRQRKKFVPVRGKAGRPGQGHKQEVGGLRRDLVPLVSVATSLLSSLEGSCPRIPHPQGQTRTAHSQAKVPCMFFHYSRLFHIPGTSESLHPFSRLPLSRLENWGSENQNCACVLLTRSRASPRLGCTGQGHALWTCSLSCSVAGTGARKVTLVQGSGLAQPCL